MLADPAGDALLAELNHHPDMAGALAAAAGERELGSAESVTQVMQWRLENHRGTSGQQDLGGPLPWLPTVPDSLQTELHAWTVRRAQAITDRSKELAGIVAAEQPAWAAPLGDRPAERASARDWERAAALAAAYREQFAVTDESTILGPDQPNKGAQGRARKTAAEAVRVAERWHQSGPIGRATSPETDQYAMDAAVPFADRLARLSPSGRARPEADEYATGSDLSFEDRLARAMNPELDAPDPRPLEQTVADGGEAYGPQQRPQQEQGWGRRR